MYNPDYGFVQQGWECPRCHRIYSPSQPYCLFCNNTKVTYSTHTTPEWIYKENTTTGVVDDLVRQHFYDDEDLWGKPL